MSSPARRRFRLLTAFLLTAAALQPLTAPAASAAKGGCEEVAIPVSLLGESSAQHTVSGTLCLPSGRTPNVVQLLMHGATYNREYFDFGYKETIYSYTRHANAAGYATLNIDRLGAGTSSRPPSSQMTPANVAFTAYQVVQALRTSVNGKNFDWVQGVGHSMGSVALGMAATTYGGFDSLILTGMGHDLSESAMATAGSIQQPANLEAKWAHLDGGYMTTVAGLRGNPFFYHMPTTSPGALAHDEATKDAFPLAEMEGLGIYPAITHLIDVPTLVMLGEFDGGACGEDAMDCSTSATLQAEQDPFFSSAACMRALSIPDTGHNLQTHRTTLLSSALMLAWSQLVTGGGNGGGNGCTAVQSLWPSVEAPLMNSAPALTALAGN